MKKPTFFIAPPNPIDEFVDERVVRALQDSPLHLFSLGCLVADPEHPNTEVRLLIKLNPITDGRRGFLMVSEDFAPPITESELEEFMIGVCEASSWTVRDAYAFRLATIRKEELVTKGILNLIDCESARAELEAAYELAFEGKPAIDHAAFLNVLDGCGWGLCDEEGERRTVGDLDGYIDPPAALP